MSYQMLLPGCDNPEHSGHPDMIVAGALLRGLDGSLAPSLDCAPHQFGQSGAQDHIWASLLLLSSADHQTSATRSCGCLQMGKHAPLCLSHRDSTMDKRPLQT